MKGSIKRTLKSRQIGLVQTYHLIDGTAGAPADSGLDKAYVASVVDNGVGSWTINFIEPARLDVVAAGLASLTAGATLSVSAVDKESITVSALSDAGAAMDADFALSVVHSKLVDAIF
jgi:hypothetical protein